MNVPRSATGRIRQANSVELDSERWRQAWYRRRMTLMSVSETAGKCPSWASMMARKGHMSYFTLDYLASEIGEDTEALLWEVGSDRERERIQSSMTVRQP